MKNIIVIIMFALTVFSCKKSEKDQTTTPTATTDVYKFWVHSIDQNGSPHQSSTPSCIGLYNTYYSIPSHNQSRTIGIDSQINDQYNIGTTCGVWVEPAKYGLDSTFTITLNKTDRITLSVYIVTEDYPGYDITGTVYQNVEMKVYKNNVQISGWQGDQTGTILRFIIQ